MTSFQEYASYGAAGVAAFVLLRLVIPFIKSLTTRSGLEMAVLSHARDQIDHTNGQMKAMQERIKELEEQLSYERKLRKELENERK